MISNSCQSMTHDLKATKKVNEIQQLLVDSYPLNLLEADKERVKKYFKASWKLYEWLFSGLDQTSAKIQDMQPSPFRYTLAFYYGHTAAFYANCLRKVGLLDKPIALWDESMATGVWPKYASDIHSQDWASFCELQKYRDKVYYKILEIIDKEPFVEPINEKSPLWALIMAIEHEFIHFQTIIPLIRQVPLDLLSPPEEWQLFSHKNPPIVKENKWLSFSGGMVDYGRTDKANEYYGWDNEYGQATIEVKPFRVKQYPVTNREFLEFIKSGGYKNLSLWTTPEVDIWFQTLVPEHPVSWVKDEGGHYRYRSPFQEIDMPWEWPVELNKHEAEAYANWVDARLINEAEFHYLLQKDYPNINILTAKLFDFNVNMRYCSPAPVGSTLPSSSNTQVDLLGNVSRWAHGSFLPISKKLFNTHALYPDFSSPWFRGDHSVLLGASYTSLGHMMHIGLMRDFMQNHMDQVAGITLVMSET